MFAPDNALVTFSDFSLNREEIDGTSSPSETTVVYDFICTSNENNNVTPSQNFDPLPLYPYSFNPDIYKQSTLSIPRNILRTIPDNQSLKFKDISVRYHMPHWNYVEFTSDEQKEFIKKYFPERLGLYKKYTREEERTQLFIYLWMYMNGGIYLSSDYELLKSLEPLIDSTNKNDTGLSSVDLYFMYDPERYISTRFFASQPFCGFWIDLVNLMEKRKKYKYTTIQEEIDRNSGRGLLTDVVDETRYKFEIIPRSELDPYTPCDTNYNKDSYLIPIVDDKNFMTYVSCQTGTSTEMLHITIAIIFIILIMVIIALITK